MNKIIFITFFICSNSALSISPFEKDFFIPPPFIEDIRNNNDLAKFIVVSCNAVIGCIKSGIGAVVNNGNFIDGCAGGVLGSFIASAGEEIASFNRYPMLGMAGKLVNDLGVSVQDNAMRNEELFSSYTTDFGPFVFTWTDKWYPEFSFTLCPLAGIISGIASGAMIDWKQTAYNFTPVLKFRSERYDTRSFNGVAFSNVIWYYEPKKENLFHDYLIQSTLSHEMNHVLFYSRLRFTKDLIHYTYIPYIDDIQDWVNVGQDITFGVYNLFQLSDSTYYYIPTEIEARIYQYKLY